LTLVTARDDEEASIVWVIGELDDFTVGSFEDECRRIASRSTRLVVELSSCSFLSSAGLGALARLQRRHPRGIALVTGNAQYERLFVLAGLGHLLPRFTNVVDAMAAYDDAELWNTRLSTAPAATDSAPFTGFGRALRIDRESHGDTDHAA
jgi:anti-anti-sigma factor